MIAGLSAAKPAAAVVLRFDAVLQQAEQRAYDLRIARADLEISHFSLAETRASYFPSLDLQFYNEYVHVPDESAQGIVSVGGSVSTALASTYQHSVVANVNYALYDFGARFLRCENARRRVDIARLNLDRGRVALHLQVLEAYARGLRVWRRQNAALQILALRKRIYRTAEEFREAGVLGRRRLETVALELAEALGRADDLGAEFQKALNAIGFFTGKRYPAGQTGFSDLPEPALTGKAPEAERLPEIRALEAEIDGKRIEVEIARKEMLPRLMAYGAYRMYGNDTNSFTASMENLAERDATVAVAAEWNLFSGFRDISKVRRLKAEIRRLTLEKQKRTAELERDIRNSYQNHRFLAARDGQRQKRRLQIRQSRETDRRLADRQVIDRIAHLEHEIGLVGQRLDLELKKIERAVAGLKLAFWREGQAP